MLRGVNRRIIEINDCGSVYFERAIFILRADSADIAESKLKSEANKLISDMSQPPHARRKKYLISRKALWLITVLSLVCTAALIITRFV